MSSNPYFGVGGFGQGGFGNQPIEALPIGYYLNLLTSEYSNSVKLQKLLYVLLKKFDDVSQCLVQMDTAFDLDSAVGAQLNMLGQVAGVSRVLPFQPSFGVSPVLNDATYRLLIKAKIGQNQWDGTQGTLYAIWINLFPTVSIAVGDNQNMTATLFIGGLPSSIIIDMIAGYAVNGAAGTAVASEQVAGGGTAFSLSRTPVVAGTLQLFNGATAIWPGVDYTIAGAAVTMNYSVIAGHLHANYQFGSVGLGGTPVAAEQVAGSGTSFTLANVPVVGTLQLFNGATALWPTIDYSITGAVITMNYPVAAGNLWADYQFGVGGGGGAPVSAEQVTGSGTAFTLAHAPAAGTLQLFNGATAIWPGVDYTVSGLDITMNYSVAAGALWADYQFAVTSGIVQNGLIVPRSEGVEYLFELGELPAFGFDLDNTYVAGFDVGKWSS
jgi:hypothetical protein